MSDDIVCQIVRGELATAEVARTDDMIAFLDHRPVFKGHVLISPIQHVDTLLDLPAELMEPLLTLGQRVAAALGAALGAQGTFVAMNNVSASPYRTCTCTSCPGPRATGCAASSGRGPNTPTASRRSTPSGSGPRSTHPPERDQGTT